MKEHTRQIRKWVDSESCSKKQATLLVDFYPPQKTGSSLPFRSACVKKDKVIPSQLANELQLQFTLFITPCYHRVIHVQIQGLIDLVLNRQVSRVHR